MPTYVYDCSNCGDVEVQHSIHDEALTVCTRCGGPCKRAIRPGATICDLPGYLSDGNISANANHERWLKTPEAKAMNLEHDPND